METHKLDNGSKRKQKKGRHGQADQGGTAKKKKVPLRIFSWDPTTST